MSRFFSQKKDTIKKAAFSSSSNDFPDLVTNNPNTKTTTMNYKHKLKFIERKVESTIKPGHISLFYDKITHNLCIEKSPQEQQQEQQKLKLKQYPSTPSFEKLVNHWEKWYDDYIDLYGEDIYAEVHLYPFYNYNYFNELDDIFYRELEELEKMEETEYEEYEE